jgi:hypothetical protein
MSSNNHSFTIRDERLEWDREDPWSAFEVPEESSDGDSEGDTVVKSSERRRTLLIAGQGALAGGLLGAFVATVVTLSSASGAPSPQPAVHPAPAPRNTSAVVLGPAATPHEAHPTVAHKTHKAHPKVAQKAQKATPKHTQARRTHPYPSKQVRSKQSHTTKEPRVAHRHTTKEPPKHTKPASTARIHLKPTHHDHRSSK